MNEPPVRGPKYRGYLNGIGTEVAYTLAVFAGVFLIIVLLEWLAG